MRESAWPRKSCTARRSPVCKYPKVPAVWRKKQRPRVISCAESEAFNPRRLPDCRLVTQDRRASWPPAHILRCFVPQRRPVAAHDSPVCAAGSPQQSDSRRCDPRGRRCVRRCSRAQHSEPRSATRGPLPTGVGLFPGLLHDTFRSSRLRASCNNTLMRVW
jgi:hypothetical protein